MSERGTVARLIDRAVASVDPVRALQRERARVRLGALSSNEPAGHHGGSVLRKMIGAWLPRGRTSPDAVDLPQLDVIRDRSRDLMRNSPPGRGAILTRTSHVIGTGLALNPRPHLGVLGWTPEQSRQWSQEVLARWCAWFETSACDITGRQGGYQIQRLAYLSALTGGDVFAVLPRIDKVLKVQLVEAERVSNKDNAGDTPLMARGIEMDANGRPLAAWIANRPQTSLLELRREWTRVPFETAAGRVRRRGLLHVCPIERPLQTRGLPYLTPVIEQLRNISTATDAELGATVLTAMMAVFVKSKTGEDSLPDMGEGGDGYQPSSGEGWDMKVSTDGVSIIGLQPDEDIVTAAPGRPNSNFDPFVQAILAQIGMALDIPYEVLAKQFKASYSASRAALQVLWQSVRQQREWMADQFCQPLYETWLAHEVADGNIRAPGFFDDPVMRWAYARGMWVGDGPPNLDPEKEVKAARERMALGISTGEEETRLYSGGDYLTNIEQRGVEEAARRAAGITVAAPDPQEPEPPDGPGDDGRDTDDDTEDDTEGQRP